MNITTHRALALLAFMTLGLIIGLLLPEVLPWSYVDVRP